MSDRFYAEMTIGGDLKDSDIQEFLNAFQNQGVYNKDGSKHSGNVTIYTQLADFMNEDMRLQVHDCEAAGGELAELQAVCIRLGLSFDHHNKSYYDCDSSNEYVRDGKELGCSFSSQPGQTLVGVGDLQKEFGINLERIRSIPIDDVVTTLRRLARLDVPRVPEFKIVEG